MVDWRPDGQPYCVLTDFGLVKVIGSTDTLTTNVRGTIDYMAPEQISEELWGEVSPATDIYALGVMVHKMLTGHAPFEGNPAKVMAAHLGERPTDPSARYDTVSPTVACAILRALEKDPAERYPRAADMVSELRAALVFDGLPPLTEDWESATEAIVEAPADLDVLPFTIDIPEGPFWMGSEDAEAAVNEKPRHLEHLAHYAIAKYPVTNAQYQAFVQATGHSDPPHWQGQEAPAGKERHPVVNVSYQDAHEYCRWLSQMTHYTYRLPTEYEWEKAARGPEPETRRYPWGDDWVKGWCNSAEEDRQDTTAVDHYGEHNASPYGIVDLVGNVWEWTDSLYRPYPGSTHYSSAYGTAYVVRGGSWRNGRQDVRASARGRYKLGIQRPYLGFRVVLEIDR
jgi:formylglycine-generating enzyme required for sulfatase activity